MATKFDVLIEGERVDLKVGAGFDLELKNPVLSFDAPAGSFAAGISLSDSARNRALLGNIGHPKVRGANRLFYCEIVEGGNLVDKGYVKLKDGQGGFDFDFVSNLREFFGQYQSKLLSEIDFGVVSFPSSWNSVTSYTWNSGGFCLPTIINPDFYDKDKPSTYTGKVNDYVGGVYTDSTKVPMFFLKDILKRIGVLSGVSFVGDFWDSAMAGALVVYNTKSLDGETGIVIRKHLPELTVAELVLSLRKLYDLALYFDVKRKVLRMDFVKDIFTGPVTLDWTRYMKKIKYGTMANTDGLEMKFAVDSGDGLSKDVLFDNYLTDGATNVDGGRIKVDTAFSSLVMVGGVLTTKQVGVSNVGSNLDKKFGARLIYYAGGATASNAFGGVVLKWAGNDGLIKNFWAADEKFRMGGYWIDELAALGAYEVARVAAIFRGESDELPIVHIDGVNWMLDRVAVKSEKSKIGVVKAWRI
jgi:hypothetical protein